MTLTFSDLGISIGLDLLTRTKMSVCESPILYLPSDTRIIGNVFGHVHSDRIWRTWNGKEAG